jgi:AhpD family alkylhydroperoxidase
MSNVKTPWYILNAPEIGHAYHDFNESCKQKGVLDKKTKELLMIALACVLRCPQCTEEHLRGALNAGASKTEITETLLIAANEGAGTQLAWCKNIFIKYLG